MFYLCFQRFQLSHPRLNNRRLQSSLKQEGKKSTAIQQVIDNSSINHSFIHIFQWLLTHSVL